MLRKNELVASKPSAPVLRPPAAPALKPRHFALVAPGTLHDTPIRKKAVFGQKLHDGHVVRLEKILQGALVLQLVNPNLDGVLHVWDCFPRLGSRCLVYGLLGQVCLGDQADFAFLDIGVLESRLLVTACFRHLVSLYRDAQ